MKAQTKSSLDSLVSLSQHTQAFSMLAIAKQLQQKDDNVATNHMHAIYDVFGQIWVIFMFASTIFEDLSYLQWSNSAETTPLTWWWGDKACVFILGWTVPLRDAHTVSWGLVCILIKRAADVNDLTVVKQTSTQVVFLTCQKKKKQIYIISIFIILIIFVFWRGFVIYRELWEWRESDELGEGFVFWVKAKQHVPVFNEKAIYMQ